MAELIEHLSVVRGEKRLNDNFENSPAAVAATQGMMMMISLLLMLCFVLFLLPVKLSRFTHVPQQKPASRPPLLRSNPSSLLFCHVLCPSQSVVVARKGIASVSNEPF
jgi:hypothetical protein